MTPPTTHPPFPLPKQENRTQPSNRPVFVTGSAGACPRPTLEFMNNDPTRFVDAVFRDGAADGG